MNFKFVMWIFVIHIFTPSIDLELFYVNYRYFVVLPKISVQIHIYFVICIQYGLHLILLFLKFFKLNFYSPKLPSQIHYLKFNFSFLFIYLLFIILFLLLLFYFFCRNPFLTERCTDIHVYYPNCFIK